MNNRYNNLRRSTEPSVTSSSNAPSNEDNLILKINPRYQVLTRPYASSEYRRLKDSIKEIGQEQPITIDEDGQILDEYHRLKVCKELGITTTN